MPQSRRHERPRSSRSQHSNPGGGRCLSSASVAQMLAAASIKVMDALFGFPARNDAECCKRELLGRSWRRDWRMRRSSKNFEDFKFSNVGYEFRRSDALGKSTSGNVSWTAPPGPPNPLRHMALILIGGRPIWSTDLRKHAIG